MELSIEGSAAGAELPTELLEAVGGEVIVTRASGGVVVHREPRPRPGLAHENQRKL